MVIAANFWQGALTVLKWIGIVLLTLLKILGWALLVILLLLLLILLIICISPIRYKVIGQLKKEIKESGGGAEVFWLWGALRGGGMYADKALRTWIKIFWIRKNLSGDPEETGEQEPEDAPEAEPESRKRAEADKSADTVKSNNDIHSEKSSEPVTEEVKSETQEPATEAPQETPSEPVIEEVKPEAEENKTEVQPKFSFGDEDLLDDEELSDDENLPNCEELLNHEDLSDDENLSDDEELITVDVKPEDVDRLFSSGESDEIDEIEITPEEPKKLPRDILSVLSDYEDKLDELIEKIEGNLDGTSGKVKEIKDKADPYLTLVKDKKNQKAVIHVLKELLALLKKLLPTRSDVDLKYSAGSPDTTGKTYGIFFMIPACYRNGWYIEPDFEAEKFYAEGELAVSGQFYIGSVVLMLLRLLVDRNIWHAVFAALRLKKQLNKEKG